MHWYPPNQALLPTLAHPNRVFGLGVLAPGSLMSGCGHRHYYREYHLQDRFGGSYFTRLSCIHPNRVFGLGVSMHHGSEFGRCHPFLPANVTPEIKTGEPLTPPPFLTQRNEEEKTSALLDG
jgi:hypothetical protein